MKALDGHRGHLTHIQFHSYGGDPDDQATFCSEVPRLVEYVNSHENLTVDVGQVMFGETTSMTGDGPLGYFLHQVMGRKWFNSDTEMEAGCGIVPIVYKDKSTVHSLQWAIGLEWYLLTEDPWRIAMSTDHPNGGSFLAYPEIIALLMDRGRRQDVLDRVPPAVRDRCTLSELTREYTLQEITIITRAAPARMLGLKNKGHLGPGADGDVTIYQPQVDVQQMFELPRYVIHGGKWWSTTARSSRTETDACCTSPRPSTRIASLTFAHGSRRITQSVSAITASIPPPCMIMKPCQLTGRISSLNDTRHEETGSDFPC